MPENTIITKIGAYDNPGVEKSLSSNVAISAENIKATGVHGLIEGTGITLVKDSENGTVTINGSEGRIYSAGPNINITNDIISGKDWSSDISDAVEPKLDTTAFSTVSGTFLTAHQPISADEWNSCYDTVCANSGLWGSEYDWTDEINAASANAVNVTKDWVEEQGYLTAHQQISADEWNGTYDTVLNNSAKWSTESDWTEVIEDASANAYNSAINWVEKQGYLTAHQSLDEYATINYVDSGLELKQDKGNYYSASNPSGFITGVDLSNYYTKDETSGANQLNTKFETVDENISNLYEITNTLSSTKQDNLTFNYDNDKISGINGSGFVETDLSNYYNKNEIDEKFANFGGFVTANSAEDGHPDIAEPDVKKIYLIEDEGTPDKYIEWIYSVDGSTSAWECIGDTSIDLSDYYTKFETSGAGELEDEFTGIAEDIDNLYDITDELSATKQDNLIPTDNIYISGNNEIGISGKLPFNVDDSMYAVETSAGVYIGLNEYTTNEYFEGTFGTDFTNNDFILSGDLFSANENIKYMNLSINYKVDNGAGNPDFVYKNELKISGAEINENYVHYIPGYISTDSYSVFLNVQNNSPFKFTLSSESTQHTGDEIKINVLGIKYHYPEEYEEIVDENDVDKLMVFNKTITTIDAGDDSILVDDDDSTLDIGY